MTQHTSSAPTTTTRVATVHGGHLQRWYEQLCRLAHEPLGSLRVAPGENRLDMSMIPAVGGVYAFWWSGAKSTMQAPRFANRLVLKGPGGRPVEIEFDQEWLTLDVDLPIPLYVGKTGNIRNRVVQHLLVNRARALPAGIGTAKAERPTSSCQLRAGIDQMFPNDTDTRPLVLDNVSLSYVELDGDRHAANRFYLEDLAVGLMRPPLNIDVER